jgi:nucleotide-sensitive chloride channel 1A
MALGLSLVTERTETGAPVVDSENDESIAHIQPDVLIVLGEAHAEGPGTLYVTTRRLVWFSNEDVHKGYAVTFIALTMHAISRDVEAYPEPCIYTQIETGKEDDEYEEDDEAEEPLPTETNGSMSDLSVVDEMRLVPKDPSVLDHLFQVLCDCALLNPDAEVEQEGEADWIFDEDEVLGNGIGAKHDNNNVDLNVDLAELLHHDPRFEDAEEEESDRK